MQTDPMALKANSLFITGTDTHVGKTLFSALMVKILHQLKKEPRYFKPCQTGEDDDTQTVLELTGLSSTQILAPLFRYLPPTAPGRAAAALGEVISLEKIRDSYRAFLTTGFGVVEGAGGLLVPLNLHPYETVQDLIQCLNIPAILVCSTRLGTINHTLLSLSSLKSAGIPILGFVLNGPEDPGLKNILQQASGTPCIAEVPQWESPNEDLLDGWVRRWCSSPYKDIFMERLGWNDLTSELPLVERAETSSKQNLTLAQRDLQTVWHPYTQHGLGQIPLGVRSASGSSFELEDGTVILDAISSWWVNLLGHTQPAIAQAIARQAKILDHVIFAGFTHHAGVELAEILIQSCRDRGASLERVFYSDNGSTAVEVALKMAFQFHRSRDCMTRTRFLALRGSYHGDTFGAMAVGDPDGFHPMFRPLLAPVDFVTPDNLAELEKVLQARGHEYAAWIVEPLVQGAGGMKMHSPEYLRKGMKLCRKYGIPIVFDEVFTGFYRTGTAFAFEQVGEFPDFLCLSKGITGGFLPLAVTLTTREVFDSFSSDQLSQAFLHGHSYTGNPIACAAALASWKVLHSNETQERIQSICHITRTRLKSIQSLKGVSQVRALGTIGAIELSGPSGYYSQLGPQIRAGSLKKGVLLRPLGNILYTVPPYSFTDAELHRVYDVIESLIMEIASSL